MAARRAGLAVLVITSLLAGAAVEADEASVGGAGIGNTGQQTFHGPVEIGASPEQVRMLIDAATGPLERLNDQLRAEMRQLADRLAVTEPAVQTMLRTLGEQDVPPEKLPTKLAEVAERHKAMLARLAALDPEDPAIWDQIEEARAAIEAGAYDRADLLLSAAEDADLVAARMAEDLAYQAQAAADWRRLNAAATRAERGELSLAQLDYLTAAQHFRKAAEIVPPPALEARTGYLNRHAGALQDHGDQKGDNAALLQAIAVYKQTLAEPPREHAPLSWAATQTNLGLALLRLGEREAGTARLEEAVAAFRAALFEFTREHAPLDWAMAWNNLGGALLNLGTRVGDAAHLEEAVAAYQTALEELTRERDPRQWTMTQTALGSALQALGGYKGDAALLAAAVAAYEGALQELSRERAPLQWAQLQDNIGNILLRLGVKKSRPELLEAALDAVRGAYEMVVKANMIEYKPYFESRLRVLERLVTEAKRGS